MIYAWLARTFTKPLAWLIAALVVFALLGAVYGWITARPKAETRLAKNQAAAALANGSDAVNDVASQAAVEAASNDLTRSNEHEIRNADGAAAPVAAGARDAGLRALCRRRAYQGDPKCVQFTPAR